ncbi:preprotein translocase subunit SecE [bacterium]|nr:preprotein translocase subunit SecE [bacterium]
MIETENSVPNWITKSTSSIQTYFRGVRSEWGKISWPERHQVITETIFVVAIVFVFTVAVYLMDIIFKGVLSLIK